MARRPNIDYTAVREMPISAIAEIWHEELRMPRELVQQELQIAVLNLARNWREAGLMPEIPDNEELPPVTTRLSKEQIQEFCLKQRWPLPRFWFPEEAEEARPRGRPSHMGAIVQELERRGETAELEATVTEQAHVLNEWAVDQGNPPLRIASIRNRISGVYRRLKDGH